MNETLLDLRGLDNVFVEFGLEVSLRHTWFTQTLRDGFALTLAGRYLPFGEIARMNADVISPGLGDALLASFTQLELHEDVVEAIRAFAAAEIPLVTLSVGDAAIAQGAMRRMGIDQHFLSYLSCSQVAKWKPAAEPYLLGCAELGHSPRDVLMVASHSWDLAGAQAVGMRTVWIARGEESPAPWLDESIEVFQGLQECAAAMIV